MNLVLIFFFTKLWWEPKINVSYHNEHVDLEQPEGTSDVSVFSVDPVDHIFDQFKSLLDTKHSFKSTFPLSDSDAKKLKREAWVTCNSKFKAMRNIFCLMQKSRNIAPLCSITLKKGEPRGRRSHWT